jgi:hypothetical protein
MMMMMIMMMIMMMMMMIENHSSRYRYRDQPPNCPQYLGQTSFRREENSIPRLHGGQWKEAGDDSREHIDTGHAHA